MFDLSGPEFRDEDTARKYLEKLRWPTGPVCPHCGNSHGWPIKGGRPGLYRCTAYECREQFTVTVGTVFESSKVPLNKWLTAVYLMCASEEGVSAHQLHFILGVTYKTAWLMTHRVRLTITESFGSMISLGGAMEADGADIGNEPGRRWRRVVARHRGAAFACR
jgi:transposase-like protein